MKIFCTIDGGTEINLYGEVQEIIDRIRKDPQLEVISGWFINRRGLGAGYAHYDYLLERDGLRLCIGRDDRFTSTPPARLIVGYSWLRRLNFDVHALAIALESVSEFITVESHTLGRLDINATCKKSITEVGALIADHFYTYSRKVQKFFRRVKGKEVIETIVCGNSEISLRIYDKTRELAEKSDTFKYDDLETVFKDCADLTRFEWRLRRRFLTRYNIDTIEDLEARWVWLCDYVCKWSRFQNVVKADDNDKQKIMAWWSEINLALKNITEHNKHYILTNKPKPKRISGKYLLTFKRAVTTLALSLVPVCENFDEALNKALWLLERYKGMFSARFDRKRFRFKIQEGIL